MRARNRRPGTLTALALSYLAISILTSPAMASVGPTVTCVDHILYLDRDTGTGALFLNPTAPTSTTPQFIDSPFLSAANGNPYKVIGAWETAVSSSCRLDPVSNSLSALHVWIGLKNSDDIGTNFDLLAQVFINGNAFPLRSAEARCITGVPRNPANAKEVVIDFGTFGPSSTPVNSIAIKISARIGTPLDSGTCPGHQAAVGVRLYLDAVDRDSRFDVLLEPFD